MKRSIPLLLFVMLVALTTSNAQSFQHSWGFSIDFLRYQTYSFTQYSQTRPPHQVTPAPVSDWLIPLRYNPRWGLLKASETRNLNLELNFPIDMGLFVTTDEYQKKGNYFALHLPAMLGLAYGEGASTLTQTKNKWGGFIAAGASFNAFSGVLGKKQYITPCASIGGRVSVYNEAKKRNRLIEFSYTIGILPEKEVINNEQGTIAAQLEKPLLRKYLKYSQNIFSLTFSLRNKPTSK